MKEKIFIDTGAFYARYVPKDDHHRESLSLWDLVRSRRARCLTSNLVVVELATLIAYRFGARSAVTAAKEIYASHAIVVVSIERESEIAALDWMTRFSDQDFSMTDAVSFSIMAKNKITTAFTFDRHFNVAGFSRLTV